ncbi:hypothetical protein GGP96_002084 [Salinibacter ruber]|nr:hypothetical protein [Salinibacter ruber]
MRLPQTLRGNRQISALKLFGLKDLYVGLSDAKRKNKNRWVGPGNANTEPGKRTSLAGRRNHLQEGNRETMFVIIA